VSSKEEPEEIRWMREQLRYYDEGLLTAGETEGRVYRHVLGKLVESLQQGQPVWAFGSVCRRGEAPPAQVVGAVIVFGDDEFRILPAPVPPLEAFEGAWRETWKLETDADSFFVRAGLALKSVPPNVFIQRVNEVLNRAKSSPHHPSNPEDDCG
jgi:hypothetical protein